ncbi:MAG: flagellar hook-basal body complex protein FliE [Gammaproteobacteria bacterium]|jgi:flagellar hook-basal body complex protein FliE|nr:flagellar hook-basal body complex protein FliE [Gammaproteobacteria bacterium]
MSDMNVQSLLAQMRVMEAQSKMGIKPVSSPELVGQPQQVDFSNMLKNTIEAVNATSLESARVADAFERGDSNISLAQMMLTMEKANVSFQAMTQVRNRLLTAYQEIMNMPV